MPGNASIALEPSRDGSRLLSIDIMKAELVVYDVSGGEPKVAVQTQIGAVPIQIEAF